MPDRTAEAGHVARVTPHSARPNRCPIFEIDARARDDFAMSLSETQNVKPSIDLTVTDDSIVASAISSREAARQGAKTTGGPVFYLDLALPQN